jgi:hypothetical protein
MRCANRKDYSACSLVFVYQRFGGVFCLHQQDLSEEPTQDSNLEEQFLKPHKSENHKSRTSFFGDIILNIPKAYVLIPVST